MSAMSYHRFTAELEARIVERQMKGLPALGNDELLSAARAASAAPPLRGTPWREATVLDQYPELSALFASGREQRSV